MHTNIHLLAQVSGYCFVFFLPLSAYQTSSAIFLHFHSQDKLICRKIFCYRTTEVFFFVHSKKGNSNFVEKQKRVTKMLKNPNAVKLKTVDGAVFQTYRNYNDVPKLPASCFSKTMKSGKTGEKLQLMTLRVRQTFLPKIYLSCSFRLQTSL